MVFNSTLIMPTLLVLKKIARKNYKHILLASAENKSGGSILAVKKPINCNVLFIIKNQLVLIQPQTFLAQPEDSIQFYFSHKFLI